MFLLPITLIRKEKKFKGICSHNIVHKKKNIDYIHCTLDSDASYCTAGTSDCTVRTSGLGTIPEEVAQPQSLGQTTPRPPEPVDVPRSDSEPGSDSASDSGSISELLPSELIRHYCANETKINETKFAISLHLLDTKLKLWNPNFNSEVEKVWSSI